MSTNYYYKNRERILAQRKELYKKTPKKEHPTEKWKAMNPHRVHRIQMEYRQSAKGRAKIKDLRDKYRKERHGYDPRVVEKIVDLNMNNFILKLT